MLLPYQQEELDDVGQPWSKSHHIDTNSRQIGFQEEEMETKMQGKI